MAALRVSRFTPGMMTPEDIEAIFVQRHDLANQIVDDIRAGVLGGSKHHWLLVGPRGIGKSHMIALAYHRIDAMTDLRDKVRVAWLREDEWGVTRLLDLFLRILRALDEQYPEDKLSERVEPFYQEPPDVAEELAGELLKDYVAGRTLLVLAENLDELFSGLGSEGQQRLRAYIQENPFWSICATSQSLFNGVKQQTSPFYGFFRVEHLETLDVDEAVQLLQRIAERDNDTELVEFLGTPTGRARVRAVQHLSGGNHRVYVILSDFLTRESLDQLVDPVMRTLDDLTPYYQARMSWLPPQQRKIVELLCDLRGAVTVKDLAKRCFLSHQVTSSQLKGLRDKGYVQSTAIGRESYYELREPLMRICVEAKKHGGRPIPLLVDFLRIWYTPSQLEQRFFNGVLGPGAEREYLAAAVRAQQGDESDPRVWACLRDMVAQAEGGNWLALEPITEELVAVQPSARAWALRGGLLLKIGKRNEARRAFREAFNADADWTRADWVDSGTELLVACALGAAGRWRESFQGLNLIVANVGTEVDAANTILRVAEFLFAEIADGTLPLGFAGEAARIIEEYDTPLGFYSVLLLASYRFTQHEDQAAVERWLGFWRAAATGSAFLLWMMRIVEKLLDYHRSHDERVFLELPLEERQLCMQLVEQAREDNRSQSQRLPEPQRPR